MIGGNVYKFIGKKNRFYELDIKLNANCKQEEKNGTGPGSCGGSKKESNNETTPKFIVPTLPNGEIDMDAKLPDGSYVHNFSSGEEYFKSKEFRQQVGSLFTERQAHYLREFTEMGAKSVNNILEKGKENSLEPNDFDARMLRNVDNAMKKSTINKNETLYMGLDITRSEIYENASPGEVITFKRFSSTSRDFDQAGKFARGGWGSGIKLVPKTILEIEVPSGTHGIDMVPFAEPWTYKVEEKEVLLDRGLSFEVIGNYKKDNYNVIKVKVRK